MRKIAIDTNLLILLVVGSASRDLVGLHKRTQQFMVEDYDLLVQILSQFSEVIVTPNVLTETSNLIRQIQEPQRGALAQVLRSLIDVHPEQYLPSSAVVKHKDYFRLGLTDCALLQLIGEDVPLITVDLDLYLVACSVNHHAVNFNHIRAQRLLS